MQDLAALALTARASFRDVPVLPQWESGPLQRPVRNVGGEPVASDERAGGVLRPGGAK